MKKSFNFGQIAEAVEFLHAFSEGNTFGIETDNVQELLSFVEDYLCKMNKPERKKLTDIAHIEGEWKEGGHGLFRFGKAIQRRRIYREPPMGELYVEYLRVRYRRSDFPPEEDA